MFSFLKPKKIYLDHAATTPIDGRVLSAMNEVYSKNYFNPGGLYADGVATARLILGARKSVAALVGTTSDHIVFTRGGTESNNMAILGVVEKFRQDHPGVMPHTIVSEIEHSAVLETARFLEAKGEAEVSFAPVNAEGVVDMDALKKLLRPETVLISVMYVNNEIGTVQPVKEITKLARWYKKQHGQKVYPLVYTDAIQAANYLDMHVDRLGVDLMSLSGSKIYGPKSSGVLYVRNRDLVSPMFHGGEQEKGLRAGTEDIAQVIGFARALEIARSDAEQESSRLRTLQDFFFAELEKMGKGTDREGVHGDAFEIRINGSHEHAHRIPNNINISIAGISSERLVIELDAKGIAIASKSACREDADEESYVIAALRRHQEASGSGAGGGIEGSLRFTMGRSTTKADLTRTVAVLGKIVSKIKAFEKTLG